MTTNINPFDFFDEILIIYNNTKLGISDKYPKYRRLLDTVCKDLTRNEAIQFSNLFSRLSFLSDKYQLDKRKNYQIHSFRVKANKVIHDGTSPTDAEHKTHFKALCEVVGIFYQLNIPANIVLNFPKEEVANPKIYKNNITLKKVRVTVEEIFENKLICFLEGIETDTKIIVKVNVPEVNDKFDFVQDIWKGAQLNLLNVAIDDNGHYTPKIIILEPDYLVDISGIAECFQDFGVTPLHYLKSKFTPAPNSKHIRLGNYANRVIDNLINEGIAGDGNYLNILMEDFKTYPFEYTTCFRDIEDEFRLFLDDCESQFTNLQNVINNDFVNLEVDISLDDIILEPSFLSEDYGIQGRLDILSKKGDNFKIVELKSGKPPWPDNGHSIKDSNLSQLFLYYQMLQSVYSIPFDQINNRIKGYILYSKPTEGNLRTDTPNLSRIQEIFNIRNQIILNEHHLANAETIDSIEEIMLSYNTENIVTKDINPIFLNKFIEPPIIKFRKVYENLNELEKIYFYSFISFIAREHYFSKLGNSDYDSNNGLANLWLSSFDEKKEKFEILYDLTISSNSANDDSMNITFHRPSDVETYVNFRVGDICVLYPKRNDIYDVRKTRILKCTLIDIKSNSVSIKLRDKQRNLNFFDAQENKYWALEHDFMDYGILSMYRGLYCFIASDERKRKLIFGIEEPIESKELSYNNPELSSEQNRVIKKAINTKDYFLLFGPPGTGKTNIILKEIVHKLCENRERNILILAYTNRAVDEICDSLTNAFGTDNKFIRIGSEFSCNEKYRHRLLSNAINSMETEKGCLTRQMILELIGNNQIFVSTIASVSGKADLFDLVDFDFAIIDEASQVLEPQVIGILSRLNRFILIGDHNQLPAIVLQPEEKTKVNDAELVEIGLKYLKNSLFERMFNNAEKRGWTWAYDKLTVQGRMHKDISIFPNDAFYKGNLTEALSWQKQPYHTENYNSGDAFENLLATRNMIFFPSYKNGQDEIDKANLLEAKLVAKTIKATIELYRKNDYEYSPESTIGVITPFRNQISVIKTILEKEGIENYDKIVVDTVERFQGGQKDVIIFSFAINSPYQLNSIVNMDDRGEVDRKLNVAITRARKQLIFIGDASILSGNFNYYRIIEFIKSKSGYINVKIDDVLNNNFTPDRMLFEDLPEINVYSPDGKFFEIYKEKVIQVLQNDPRTTEFPGNVLGGSCDFNRNSLIAYGRAIFDQGVFDRTPQDKVNLYCFYNMRKHYFTAMRIFDGNSELLSLKIGQVSKRTVLVDMGCGPATAGLAFNQHLTDKIDNFYFNYYGIDISIAMREKAKEFLEAGFLAQQSRYSLFETFGEFTRYMDEHPVNVSRLVIFNFSYFFSNISAKEVQILSEQINSFVIKYPLNEYLIIYQNPASESRNYNYYRFKKLVEGFDRTLAGKTETIAYINQQQSMYDKKETFVFEILGNN